MRGRNPGEKSIEERFWSKVRRTNRCWLWIGAVGTNGYGFIRIRDRRAKRPPKGIPNDFIHLSHILAHRLSYYIHHGSIPPGKIVCHHCNVKICVNPNHIYSGTYSDNAHDTIKSGKNIGKNHWARKHPEKVLRGNDHWTRKHPEKITWRGVNHYLSKLSLSDISRIRSLYVPRKFSQRKLSKMFGTKQGTIYNIVNQLSYQSHVELPATHRQSKQAEQKRGRSEAV